MRTPKKYRFKSEDALKKFVSDRSNGPENTILTKKALGSPYINDYHKPFYLIDYDKESYTRLELCDKNGNIVPIDNHYAYFSGLDVDEYLEELEPEKLVVDTNKIEDQKASKNFSVFETESGFSFSAYNLTAEQIKSLTSVMVE